MASDAPLAPEDLQLLDRLAARVVELHLEIPAILTLETGKPLSLIAGQTMVFFEPMVQSLFSFPDYRRFAGLVERREALETLIQKIEREADRVQAERRARRKPGPPPADVTPPA
jgi:hypothetical protein